MTQNELTHYGVLGMKWGKHKSRRTRSEDSKEASRIRKKSVKAMSNQELKKLNERTRLEQEYKRLNPGTIKKGIAVVAASAATMNTFLNLYNNSDKLVKAGKRVVEKFK